MHFSRVPDLTVGDVAYCRVLLRGGSKSFFAASRLLPRAARGPVAAIYAFCRRADDLVDGGGASRWTLIHLRERLDRIYGRDRIDDPGDRALRAVVRHFGIPRAVFDALLEGFGWELEGRRYDSIEDVRAYGMRVAGTVGLAVAHILGPRDPETLARVAMQLTNIARDVGEDAAVGRLYLPRDWMREEGLDPDAWLRDPSPCAGVRKVVHRLLGEAERLYTRAELGIARLPRRAQWAIRTARLIYADIGRVIAEQEYDSVRSRAFTTGWRKLQLAIRALRPRRTVSRSVPTALDESWHLVLRSADWTRSTMPHALSPKPTDRASQWHVQEELA